MAEEVIGMRGLKRRLKAIGRTGEELLDDWGPRTVRNAKQRHHPHKKTGITEASIQLGRRGTDEATVQAGGAAVYLEYGTKAHRIPKTGNARRPMPLGGERRLSGALRKRQSRPMVGRNGMPPFAWHVQHPGTKADPFLVPAGREALEEFLGQRPVERAWDKAD